MIELFLFKIAIAILFLTKFSIDDLKTTEVKDFEVYIFFSICCILGLTHLLLLNDIELFKLYLISVSFGLMLSVFLYLFGHWGIGDSYILTSLSLLFLFPSFLSFLFFYLILFWFSFYFALIYAILFSIVKKFKLFLSFLILIILAISFFLFFIFSKNFFISLFFSTLLIIFPSYFLFKEVEKKMIKKIHVKNLKVGDVLKDFKQWRGITQEEIEKIRKKYKYVEIKEGIRFLPTFLISLIIYYFAIFYFNLDFSFFYNNFILQWQFTFPSS